MAAVVAPMLSLVPNVRAQEKPQAIAAAAQAALPPTIGLPQEYPIYGPTRDPRDALARGISVESGDGDEFLLALAQAANINIICEAPASPFQVETLPSWESLGYLHAASAWGGLAWWRQSERTVLMWPQPTEDKVARSWHAWWQAQRARDEAGEAVGDAEVAAALKQLDVADTPEARRQLREEYALVVRERLQEQVRSGVFKYLGQDGAVGGALLAGRTVALSDLPPAMREAAEVLTRLKARGRTTADIWYDAARREQFWKQGRLRVRVIAPNQPRLLMLEDPDPTKAEQGIRLLVGSYDPRIYNPNGTKLIPGPVPPRSEDGLRLKGERLPLRQVLDELQKQSGLTVEAPLERLREARLTLDVRGMAPQDFLQSLARIFLVEWKVEGKRAVAQETSYDELDRLLLQMGFVLQFLESREGNNDRGEEAEMSRAIYGEAGEALLSPEGFPVAQLSPETQDVMRREGAEEVFKNLVGGLKSILPSRMAQAQLVVNDSLPQPPLSVVSAVRTDFTRDIMRYAKEPTSITVRLPQAQSYEIVALPLPTSTLPEPSRATGSQAVVENLVSAHNWARSRKVQSSQIKEGEVQAVLDKQERKQEKP